MIRCFRTLAVLFAFSLFFTRIASAQSEAGGATLSGLVTDSTSSAISGAKVRATNRDTGVARETVTSDGGVFNFPRLPIGSYDLTVEYQGFKTAKREAIPVSIGAVLNLEVKLEVGAAT